MTILVLVEHDNVRLKPATLNTVAAARAIGGDIHLLVAGADCAGVAQAAAAIPGVSMVRVAEHPALAHQLAENVAPLVTATVRNGGYTHLLAPANSFGKNITPRVAAKLDVMQISDISAVLAPDTFERPIYAGNAIATVQSTDPVKVVTVRTTKFPAVAAEGGDAEIGTLAPAADTGLSSFVGHAFTPNTRPDLTTARIVVSGGRGMGASENFRLLDRVADQLGAAVGASRAAVDAGFAANDSQVGQTGKVVAPDLYIAVGISGAIQHLAGMKDSRVIVAINKDPEAPIFQYSDYGLVADLFEAVPELDRALAAAVKDQRQSAGENDNHHQKPHP